MEEQEAPAAIAQYPASKVGKVVPAAELAEREEAGLKHMGLEAAAAGTAVVRMVH